VYADGGLHARPTRRRRPGSLDNVLAAIEAVDMVARFRRRLDNRLKYRLVAPAARPEDISRVGRTRAHLARSSRRAHLEAVHEGGEQGLGQRLERAGA